MTDRPLASYEDCLNSAFHVALEAWGRISHYHRADDLDVYEKPDGPVTDADRLADQIIVQALEKLYPRTDYGYLSEEFERDPDRFAKSRVWIIDPIDGTQDFIQGRDDFAIHIGLVERNEDGIFEPIVGIVYHPRAGRMYSAIVGQGAWVQEEIRPSEGAFWWTPDEPDPASARFAEPQRMHVSARTELSELTAVISRSHMTRRLKATVEALPLKGYYRRGSLGVKLAEVARAEADFYILTERGRCKEWDTCAPHIIVIEAGGRVTDLDGKELTYNNEDVHIHGGLLATNSVSHDMLLSALEDIPILYK
ncbi:3'(2'),5'-bisphosphate nucleotidase CysQ [bacterium]|nr:3'(2'),5'-bisphosphate nucleotidase CysQ [bacterium]